MKVDRNAVEAFKKRRARRLDARGCCAKPDREDYGTSSSGNWGHVGREGLRGGSSPGGGGAFRFTKGGNKGGFTSRAKIRVAAQKKMAAANKSLSAAKASGNADKIAKAQNRVNKQKAHNAKIIMKRKSVRDIKAAGKFDPNSSRNILKDPKGRGKTAHERQVANVSGKKTAISKTFKGTTKRYPKKKK